jgi:hypothetical protein
MRWFPGVGFFCLLTVAQAGTLSSGNGGHSGGGRAAALSRTAVASQGASTGVMRDITVSRQMVAGRLAIVAALNLPKPLTEAEIQAIRGRGYRRYVLPFTILFCRDTLRERACLEPKVAPRQPGATPPAGQPSGRREYS